MATGRYKGKKDRMTQDEWHDSLMAMRPAYGALVKITMTHRIQSVQYSAALICMNAMADLAKLHGRHMHHYFGSIPDHKSY